MVAPELKAAELLDIDDAGGVFDFHALRARYIPNLAPKARLQKSPKPWLDIPPSV